MSSEEFRDELKSLVKRHEPTADELRALADDLETLAEKYDQTEAVL